MKFRKISFFDSKHCEIETQAVGDTVLHRIKVLGPLGREERIPIYEETLKLNKSPHYFCIVDNSQGHENNLSYDDMLFFSKMLTKGGITHFFNAVVTNDYRYADIIKLTGAVSKLAGITSETVSASDPEQAEAFILEKIKETGGNS
ncbi:MAG: hypothetical protein V7701_12085 [Sneathiella sp.]